MEKFSLKLAVMLLAFSVGVTVASVFYFQSTAPPPPVPEINGGQQGEAVPEDEALLEMVFVLDTTGSMGGLLEGAKQKIWSIVNDVMQRQSRPHVRVGLVAYRDKGDAYVTQLLPLTKDLDKVYMTLMDYRADGGGDTPENVRRALNEGVRGAGWSKPRQGLAQIIFLVGDAPPQDYREEPDVLATAAEAIRKNIIVNTIQCGAAPDTRQIWQAIARAGQGQYFAIAQNGGVQEISTPFDEKLVELGRRIGATYLAYGAGREEYRDAFSAAERTANANTASNVAKADRTLNKALNKDAYQGDLIQDIENGKVKLENVKTGDLPDDLRRLPENERRQEVEKRLAERKRIREEILNLSKQRDAYLQEEAKKSNRQDGFDAAVRTSLAAQLKQKGIR